MQKVRAKDNHWFKNDVTVGKIYDFPDIIFDNGKSVHLNPDKNVWTAEFEFLSEDYVEKKSSIINNYSII